MCECLTGYAHDASRGVTVWCGECNKIIGTVKDGEKTVRDAYDNPLPYLWDHSVDLYVKIEMTKEQREKIIKDTCTLAEEIALSKSDENFLKDIIQMIGENYFHTIFKRTIRDTMLRYRREKREQPSRDDMIRANGEGFHRTDLER